MTAIPLIINPVGGRGRAKRLAEAVRVELERLGIPLQMQFTSANGDAERMAVEAVHAGVETVAVCAGDGTIQEAANALAGTSAKLAVLPGGRCNDLALALGLPHDPRAIAHIIANGKARQISLGRVNGRYFCTVATLGFDSAVSAFVHTMKMPLKGTLAYVYGVLRALPGFRSPRVELCGDFGTLQTSVFLCAVGNTPFYGGGIKIVPSADVSDDQFDVCVVPGVSRLRVLWLLPQAIHGHHTSAPEVKMLRTRGLEINSEEKLEIWADGELLAHTPAKLEVVPQALGVVCAV